MYSCSKGEGVTISSLVAKGEYWVWTLMGSLKVADSISGREYKLRPLEREKVMFGSLPEEER